MTTENYVPIVNLPSLYMNGLGISNNATTPNTLLNVAVGQCRDSGNTFDMTLSTAVVINAATNGLNGLDVGTFAASKVYAVLLVSDPVSANPSGAMLTLTPSAPTMPFGYSAYRVIGYATTDSSAHFLPGQWTAGNTTFRKFAYETRRPTAVTAGVATSYTAIDLSALVPSGYTQLPVSVYYAYTPATAGNALNMQGANRASGGSDVTITGQVATVANSGNTEVIAELVTALPKINYKVGNASDAVAISVAGYSVSL
jgi:hypothetical protein